MALDSIMKKAKSKFEDDGPPAMGDNESRGAGGSSADDGMVPVDSLDDGDQPMGDGGASDDGSGAYGDVEDQAADQLADLAGIAPDDRKDFKSALSTYVAACIERHESSGEEAGETPGDNSEEG